MQNTLARRMALGQKGDSYARQVVAQRNKQAAKGMSAAEHAKIRRALNGFIKSLSDAD